MITRLFSRCMGRFQRVLLLVAMSLLLHCKCSSSADNENFESKYQTAMDLTAQDKSNRDFRRGVSILEELSLGIGRTSADALAELAAVYLTGSRLGFLNLAKAAQYSQRSASLGSPKGRHLYSFFLLSGGLGGVARNETEAWRQEEQAAEQNYLPALMALGYRKLFILEDCESALRLYRAAAISAMNAIDTVYYSDYSSLRQLTMALDSLGDDFAAKAARDVETLSYWSFQSDRKDTKAYYELGRIYQLGLHGVRRDMALAADHYERATVSGHPGALGELGRLYTLGHGRELDFNLALKYLQQGAEAMDGTALAAIGSLLVRKVYSSEDSNMPLLYLRKAVSLNNIEGEWELAQVELREGRLDAALQHLQRAERGGHVRATMALAQLYDNGMGGLKQSCGQAVLLYKKVCEIGPWVDHHYGPREAVKEFRKGKESSALVLSLLAAMEGYEVAQFNAAWMLMRSKGMEESNVVFAPRVKENMRVRYESAASLLSSLTLQQPMNAESNVLLGDIYMGGYKVPHNLNYSALHYERAADAGNALGMERLALLLINGRGVPHRDHKRAVQLMVHALSQISSGQSKIGGVQALLKQLVLSYRIIYLKLCTFLRERLSLAFIQRGVRRIRDKVDSLSRMAQYYAVHSDPPPSFDGDKVSLDEGVSGQQLGRDSSDSFVRSAITFPNIRYLESEEEKARRSDGDKTNRHEDGLTGRKGDRTGSISVVRSGKDSGFLKARSDGKGAREEDRREDSKGIGGVGAERERRADVGGSKSSQEGETGVSSQGTGAEDSHHRSRRLGLMTGMSRSSGSSSGGGGDSNQPKSRAATSVSGARHVQAFSSQSDVTLKQSSVTDTTDGTEGKEGRESSRAKEGARRPPPSNVSSTWTMLSDFPSVIESIKSPLLSLSSSFYAYMYAPRVTARGARQTQVQGEDNTTALSR